MAEISFGKVPRSSYQQYEVNKEQEKTLQQLQEASSSVASLQSAAPPSSLAAAADSLSWGAWLKTNCMPPHSMCTSAPRELLEAYHHIFTKGEVLPSHPREKVEQALKLFLQKKQLSKEKDDGGGDEESGSNKQNEEKNDKDRQRARESDTLDLLISYFKCLLQLGEEVIEVESMRKFGKG